MKILITGGAGFVASYLAKECLEKGDEVVVTVRWNEDLSRLPKGVKTEYVELTDLSAVIRVINKHRPDVISHLAAQSWVPYSMDNPIYTMNNNTESTLNIMEAVRTIELIREEEFKELATDNQIVIPQKYNPLIHICSSSEYYGKVDRKDLPITENHKANPGNVYGISKVAGDFLAQIYSKYYDLDILITRMFTHTGPTRSMMSAENYYAREIVRCEVTGDNIIEIGDEEAMNSLRTWAHVSDAVKNYRELFLNNRRGIYNISGETTKTIREVLNTLIDLSDLDYNKLNFIVSDKFKRAINVDKQIVDISKYKTDNTWYNEITFEQLMIDLLNHWRNKNEV